jgi:outer membrane protein OmpA-like peptidoglycan-associated protein
MKHHIKKYPLILLAGIPFLTLIGCANQESVNTDTESSVAYFDTQQEPVVAYIESEPVSNETPAELITNDTTPSDGVLASSETELFPRGIQTTEPDEHIFEFAFDKSVVKEQYNDILKQHAEYLINNQQLTLQVNGHTDSMGPRVYNEWLSKKRAEAVVQLLIENGAPKDQIIISGNADNLPLIDAKHNSDNRRVELNYQDHRMVSN